MNAVPPDLSVVIVSYNTIDVTRRCLQCIVDGASDISLELYVVDNASRDGSADMVRQEFPAFQLIQNDCNLGVAAATNQGLRSSRGRYILSMNSDVLVPPGSLARLVRFMDAHPDAGGATPRLVLQTKEPHPRFIGNQPSFAAELLFALCLFHKKFADWSNRLVFEGWDDYATTRQVPCVHWGTCFVVRREVLQKVGMQDTRYFVYCEDLDWSIRIGKSGWNLYYIADIEVTHLLNQSTKSGGNRMYAQMWKSRCRLIGKNRGLAAGLLFRGLVALACSAKCSLLVVASLFVVRLRTDLRERVALLFSVCKTVLSY